MLKIVNQALYHKQPARRLVEQVRDLAGIDNLVLRIDDVQVSLCSEIQRQQTCFHHSFTHAKLVKRSRQTNQALLKACVSRKRDIHSLVDLTAGWGRDSFILATHGLQVTMVEQHPLVFECDDYLLEIAKRDSDDAVFKRIRMLNENSLEYLSGLQDDRPDCLYLDPMFPAHKSSAKPGKDLQILQLLTANRDMQQVFELALEKAARRVVVKRPLHAPTLGSDKPDVVFREKSIRFDVYLS